MTVKTKSKRRRVSERFTLSDLDRYLASLSEDTKELHNKAYLLFRDNPDTLSEDFQVAALVVGVFQNRAIEYKENNNGKK